MQQSTCTWGYDDDAWETECVETFIFFDGSPTYNDFTFCPYCGSKIVEQDQDDNAIPAALSFLSSRAKAEFDA